MVGKTVFIHLAHNISVNIYNGYKYMVKQCEYSYGKTVLMISLDTMGIYVDII